MNFMSIPDLVRVKIFLLLPSDSLHKCRQVCRGWNNFILDNIWNSNYGRKQLEDQLDRNWGATSEVLKYELSSEVFDSGFKHSDIFAAFGDHLVIGKQPYGDDFPAIVVINVITKDTWQVTMENETFNGEEVFINDSILAIWSWPWASGSNATLKVWSVKSKEKLLDEVIPTLESVVFDLDRSSSLPLIVLILEQKVEALKFGDNSISRYELAFDVDDGYQWYYSNLVFPYLLHCFDNDEDDFISLFVWKIDDENKQIEHHTSIPNFDNVHVAEDGEESELVENGIYIPSSFVVATHNKRICVIKILNDEGDLIRKLRINFYKDTDLWWNANFFIHRKRVFLSLDDGIYRIAIYKIELKKLLSLKGFRKLTALIQSRFRTHVFVTNKTSIASVTDYGEGNFKIRRMNFWPTNH